jgi:hypothetical protein
MKTGFVFGPRSRKGYALLLTLFFVGIALLIFSSTFTWTSSSSIITERNNGYNRAIAAAEASTERVLSYMSRDFASQTYNPLAVAAYRDLIPTNDWADQYEFEDGDGSLDRIWVQSSNPMVMTNLDSQFTGLYGFVYNCRVRSNARPIGSAYSDVAAGVRQDFQLAAIPVFQFAIFYTLDLEINPGPSMRITGKVHGNRDIYTSPGDSLTFMDSVGAVGKIYHNRHPDDPQSSSGILPVYNGLRVEGDSSLSLPIGLSNSPSAIVQILDAPPLGEDPRSLFGRQRYHNKADLVITTTTTNTLLVKFNSSGDGTSFTPIPDASLKTGSNYTFIRTNAAFYDYREGKQVLGTEIDVAKFNQWMTTNNVGMTLVSQKGRALNSVYVNDARSVSGRLTAVRVVNGQTLPANGLTVVTPLPLYVKGHFNATDVSAGSTNTAATKPASLVGDAITVQSGSWSDGYTSSTGLDSRPAANTTVNAAFLAGIVQTTNSAGTKKYSGGVENFPRFLENWSGKTFTYNGSMVVMFPSRYATKFWVAPGSIVYGAPNRRWAFDSNFLTITKLPPCTPQLQKLVRGQWMVVAADSPN